MAEPVTDETVRFVANRIATKLNLDSNFGLAGTRDSVFVSIRKALESGLLGQDIINAAQSGSSDKKLDINRSITSSIEDRTNQHTDWVKWNNKNNEDANKKTETERLRQESDAKAIARAFPNEVPKPVTGNTAPAQGTPTPTGNAASKALQANSEFDSGQSFEAIGPKSDGWDTDKFLKVFPKITVNGKTKPDLDNPRFFYVGGVTPIEITKDINAGQGAERILKQFATATTGVASGGGGGGGGGFIPAATTYSIQQIGGKVFSVGSDGKYQLTDIDPGYAKYEVDKKGDLYGFRADGTKTKLQEGWDFAKQDPALVVQKDSRTGESFLVNTRDPSQPKQSLGTFDFATIDPERTAAEAALQSRLGLASGERSTDQSAALSGRATDLSAASSARTQDITLQGQQFNNALDLQKYVNGLINNPTDFVNRGRLSAGLAPLGGGRITQADLVNAAKNAMGSQNFQTVRDALLPTPFVTAPKTAIPDFSKPAVTTPGVSLPPPNTAPVIPTAPTAGTKAPLAFQGSNPALIAGLTGSNMDARAAVAQAMVDAGWTQSPAAVPNPVTGTAPASAGSSPVTGTAPAGMGVSVNPLASDFDTPLAPSAPSMDVSVNPFASDFDTPLAPSAPSMDVSADPFASESDTPLAQDEPMGSDAMAYGGATRDERFIVGDRRDGRPVGTEEMIINPTRAPIQVVPNSRLAAYYGGTMPNHFAGGTDSRLGMYPRYAEGNQPTQDAISQYLRIMGDAGRLQDAYDVLDTAKISYQPSAAESARYFANKAGLSSTFGGGGAAGVPQNAVVQQNYPSAPSSVPAPQNQFDFPDALMMGGAQPNYNGPTPPGYGQQPAYDQQPQQRQSFSPDVTPYYPDPYSRYDPTTNTLYQLPRGFDITDEFMMGAQQPMPTAQPLRIGQSMPGIRGVMPRYADGVLPSVQGAPAGSLSPVTQEDLVNTAREYSPPVVSSLLGDRGAFEARMLPVQSASMRQTNNLTADEAEALGTRLALEGTSQQEYNALQKGLFGQQRTTRRGRLVV